MSDDICGCPTSLTTGEAVDAWNGVIRGFLAHSRQTPEHLERLLSLEPAFGMGHAARGLFALMLGRAEMEAPAREALAMARAGAALPGREQLWIAALADWLDGRPSGAVARMEEALARSPHDTASAKVSHAIRFILGDRFGMRQSIERALDAHGPDHPLRGYMMGCHAFALEETGAFAEAEKSGLSGLDYAADDAWGLHAVVHVYDTTARPEAGIFLIENNLDAWGECNNFRYHVWWHKALLHLERNEVDVALDLYDRCIRRDRTDDYRDIANATSLLMRLALDDCDVGDRWDELADLAEARVTDGCLVFADLHYMMALCLAGRDQARDLLIANNALATRAGNEMAVWAAHPGIAALAGLKAFAAGDYPVAFDALTAARGEMQHIGGSHAQRDVFERVTIEAGLRAGAQDAVAIVLRDRRDRRGGFDDRFSRTRFAQLEKDRYIAAE